MKLLFKRDVFLILLMAYIIYWLLSTIPFSVGKLNPFNNAISDFDLTDICFSKYHKSKTAGFDKRIVIVDIGHENREQMAAMIRVLESFKPKVIGVDVLYEGKVDPYMDSILAEQVSKEKNIVLGSQLNMAGNNFEEMAGPFASKDSLHGFVNMVGENIGTIRYFSPKEKEGKRIFYNFNSLVAKEYDSLSFKRLIARNQQTEIINYKRRDADFLIVNYEDLLNGKVNGDFFRDKIVLMGYMNSGPFDFEDKLFTPCNEKYAGKTMPDMNGVVVHANIILTILDHDYINRINPWLSWFLIVLVSWLHIAFFTREELISGGPMHHAIVKSLQFISIIILVYIHIVLFDRFDLRIDSATLVVILAIDVDVIIFYTALAKWLNKKFGFRTIYKNKVE